MLLAADRVLTPAGHGPGRVVVDGALIASIEAGRGRGGGGSAVPGRDFGDAWLVPGLVDIHAHGGGGHSFAGGAEDAAGAAGHHHRSGTTTVVASLASAPLDELAAAMTALAPLVAADVLGGLHLEGPWLAAGRCGAHDPAHLRRPEPAQVERLLAVAPDALRMVTLAPELPGGLDAIGRITAAGVSAAIGHTEATWEDVADAVAAGARVATHLFNAMPPLHHRAPGAALACLLAPELTVELIADGVHLAPAVVAWAAAAAAGRAAFVTDAVAAGGRLGGRRVEERDGAMRLAGSDVLAGSSLTLLGAIGNAVGFGVDPVAALVAATATPAAAVGLGDRVGALAPGRRADLLVLGPDLALRGVLRAGRWLVEPA